MKFLNLISCFDYWYDGTLSWNELIIFTIVSLISTTILLVFYKKIALKTNYKSTEIEKPLYNSKDFFSQEVIGDSNFILAEKTTSIFTRVVIYTLVFILITSSMSKLLSNGIIEYIY